MNQEEDRFVRTYRQGSGMSGLKNTGIMEVWVDRETGVNYLFHEVGYSGGLTPLLDEEGKPVITYVDKDFK